MTSKSSASRKQDRLFWKSGDEPFGWLADRLDLQPELLTVGSVQSAEDLLSTGIKEGCHALSPIAVAVRRGFQGRDTDDGPSRCIGQTFHGGDADAEAAEIYDQAYDKSASSRDFYEFLKSMETLEDTIDGQTSLVLSTEGDFFRYLKESGR